MDRRTLTIQPEPLDQAVAMLDLLVLASAYYGTDPVIDIIATKLAAGETVCLSGIPDDEFVEAAEKLGGVWEDL